MDRLGGGPEASARDAAASISARCRVTRAFLGLPKKFETFSLTVGEIPDALVEGPTAVA